VASQALVPHNPHQCVGGLVRGASLSGAVGRRRPLLTVIPPPGGPDRGGSSGPAPERAPEVLVMQEDGCVM
jgi:hypothetical protein